jgi:hypothetical protein
VTEGSTVARKATDTVSPTNIVPPVAPSAPVPSRTRTVREPGGFGYSPWSLSVASVFVPGFAPERIWIDPGTNVRPVGSASLRTTFVAVSFPWLLAAIVYWIVSPGRTAPFG